MKRTCALLCIAAIIISLFSGCATFDKFNPDYVRELRTHLKAEYSHFKSLDMKIGYGETLVVTCRVDEAAPADEAEEIYWAVADILCSRELVEDFLAAIDAPYGYDAPETAHESVDFIPKYSLDFYRGEERDHTELEFTSRETVFSYGYEHLAYVYRGFPGWPIEGPQK